MGDLMDNHLAKIAETKAQRDALLEALTQFVANGHWPMCDHDAVQSPEFPDGARCQCGVWKAEAAIARAERTDATEVKE